MDKSRDEQIKYIRYRRLLYTNTGLALFNLIYTLIVIIVLTQLPIPQRTRIEFMDQQMLDSGEGTFIILATTWVFTALPIYFATLITSGIVIYKYFYINIEKVYGYICNGSIWVKIGLVLYSILYLLLPLIFVWLFYKKPKEMVSKKLLNVQKVPRRSKAFWLSISTSLTFLVSLILPLAAVSFFFPDLSKTRYRRKELEEAYTLSQNKPNTMILYFDRAYGLIFNQLLAIDYIMYHGANKSMIDMFPEFSSYVHSLSQSIVTNTSNPTINASWYMQPVFKNLDVIDPFQETSNQNDTYDEFYLKSYKNSLGLLAANGYENFSIMNVPYYGSKSYQLNADAFQFQKDINDSIKNNSFYPKSKEGLNNNLKVTSLDVTEIVKSQGLKVHKNKQDEINFLHLFGASNNTNTPNPKNNNEFSYGTNTNLKINGDENYANLRVSKNKGSTFMKLYFQTTHEDYQYVKNEKWVSDNNPGGINYDNVDDGEAIYTNPEPNNLVISNWYAIQKLKRIFTYLKKLPCDDPSRPWVTNQYDNCNIYVVSDHGTPIVNKKDYYLKVNDYLIKNNMMTRTQADYIINTLFNHKRMSFGFFNTIFLRKPAKYRNASQNITNNTLNTFFNQQDLFVTSDLYPIIEADIKKQNWDINHTEPYVFNKEESWYWDTKSNDIFRLKTLDVYAKNLIKIDFDPNFILDPINNIKMKLNARHVPLYRNNWLYINFLTKFFIYGKFYFVNKYPGGVYNVNNYVTDSEYYKQNNIDLYKK